MWNFTVPNQSMLKLDMYFATNKAVLTIGKVIEQQIQLVTDPIMNSYSPWISIQDMSGGLGDNRTFFASWYGNETFNVNKTIQNLPINENFKSILRIYGILNSDEQNVEKFVTFDCVLPDVS